MRRHPVLIGTARVVRGMRPADAANVRHFVHDADIGRNTEFLQRGTMTFLHPPNGGIIFREGHVMKTYALFAALAMGSAAVAQEPPQSQPAPKEKAKKPKKGAAAEVGGGVGSAAGGVAKGAGSVASGAAKGAVDVATLHPIDAGVAVGTGAAKAGKDVTVGSVKGAGKIGKGVGHALKKIL